MFVLECCTFVAAITAGYIAWRAYEETRTQSRASVAAAVAAKRSAETAAKQLQIADRPWVEFHNPQLTSGRVLIDNGQFTLEYRAEMRNRGQSVAQGVQVIAYLASHCRMRDAVWADLKLSMEDSKPEWGDAIFPEGSQEVSVLHNWDKNPPMVVDNPPAIGPGRFFTGACMIGVIVYWDQSNIRHQTGFCFTYFDPEGVAPKFQGCGGFAD